MPTSAAGGLPFRRIFRSRSYCSARWILVEAARFLNWSSAYHLYYFHLVMVWIIILYRSITLISIRK